MYKSDSVTNLKHTTVRLFSSTHLDRTYTPTPRTNDNYLREEQHLKKKKLLLYVKKAKNSYHMRYGLGCKASTKIKTVRTTILLEYIVLVYNTGYRMCTAVNLFGL